jgi:hypothetical protein
MKILVIAPPIMDVADACSGSSASMRSVDASRS